jgi:hypothetical protein
MKVPLDSQVRVPPATGGWLSRGSLNVEVRDIYIEFQIVRQTIVELEVGGILPDIRVLKLQGVVFIEEFEVPFSLFGNPGVIGIKRQLSVLLLAEAEHTGQWQQSPKANREWHPMNN